MKRLFRPLLLLCLAVSVLTVTASADMGPKPQLTVRVANAPEELYYLDILGEGEYEGPSYGSGSSPYSGLDWSYSEEERAALDAGLLDALRAAVPNGWHACTAEGTNGAPMWGDLEPDEQGFHTFGYVGLPDTYRLLMVTKSGEVFLSDVHTRQVLQSSVTLDWAAKTVSVPPVFAAYLLQFLSTLLPTLILEGILLLLFDFSWKKNWKPFLLVNLLTQSGLSIFCAYTVMQHGVSAWTVLLSLIPAEIVIALSEAISYRYLLTGQSKVRAMSYGIFANLCSAALTLISLDHLWHRVLSIL